MRYGKRINCGWMGNLARVQTHSLINELLFFCRTLVNVIYSLFQTTEYCDKCYAIRCYTINFTPQLQALPHSSKKRGSWILFTNWEKKNNIFIFLRMFLFAWNQWVVGCTTIGLLNVRLVKNYLNSFSPCYGKRYFTLSMCRPRYIEITSWKMRAYDFYLRVV